MKNGRNPMRNENICAANRFDININKTLTDSFEVIMSNMASFFSEKYEVQQFVLLLCANENCSVQCCTNVNSQLYTILITVDTFRTVKIRKTRENFVMY